MEEPKLTLSKKLLLIPLFPVIIVLAVTEPFFIGYQQRSLSVIADELRENFCTVFTIYTKTIWE